jgi:hypothetical protein
LIPAPINLNHAAKNEWIKKMDALWLDLSGSTQEDLLFSFEDL